MPERPNSKPTLNARRKVITMSEESLITTRHLDQRRLPLVIEPALDHVNLVTWATHNQTFIEEQLLRHGAILFRNFKTNMVQDFEQVIIAAARDVMEYRERSSPRSEVAANIYTSTDHPADQHIFPHNEHSYAKTFPQILFFFGLLPTDQGGETPIIDCRKVFARIRPEIRERFRQKGWMYVRNFGDGLGLSWQTVFQTEDKAVVERYCKNADILCEWKDGGRLRTRQIRPAIIRHPQTNEEVWFNHATFFHISTLEPVVREALMASFKEEDLPNNTYYGDGTPIEPLVLDDLRDAYLQEMVMFPWQQGDIMMLDNILTAHARQPFTGSRKILVGMSRPFTRTDIQTSNQEFAAAGAFITSSTARLG